MAFSQAKLLENLYWGYLAWTFDWDPKYAVRFIYIVGLKKNSTWNTRYVKYYPVYISATLPVH